MKLDSESGMITGCAEEEGDYRVRVKMRNGLGKDEKNVCISIKKNGAGLTPLMGWSSWNAYARFVTQDDIMKAANLLLKTGLSSFGYQYVNLDSPWQGEYGGKYNAIMPNGRFTDMHGMCRHIHSLGLKVDIY